MTCFFLSFDCQMKKKRASDLQQVHVLCTLTDDMRHVMSHALDSSKRQRERPNGRRQKRYVCYVISRLACDVLQLMRLTAKSGSAYMSTAGAWRGTWRVSRGAA